jgi:hypothetical protein
MAKLIELAAPVFTLQANLLRRNGKLPRRVLPTFRVLEFPKGIAA